MGIVGEKTGDAILFLLCVGIPQFLFANPQAELLVVFSNNIDHPYGMPTAIIQVGNQLPTGEYYLRIKGEEELFVVSGEFVKKLLEAKLYEFKNHSIL